MNNIAKAIEAVSRNASEAVELAEKRAVAADQNWEEESTTYVFDDNSVLVVRGPEFFAKSHA